MKDLLRKYIKGECPPEEKEQLLQDLRAKVPSVDLLHSLKKYWYELEDASRCNTKDDDVDFEPVLNRIHHSVNLLEEEEHQHRHTFIYRFLSRVRVGAAILVVMLASAGVWYAGSSGMFQKEQFFTVASVRGQSSSIALPDGSKAWLNGESSLIYSSRYGADNRTIELDGEGFFRVAKNSGSPFIVKVRDVEITAIGTSFNVDAYEEDYPIKVTLETGRIDIKRKGHEQDVELKPGMQARIDGENIDVSVVDTELYTSWHKGQIVFKNEKLKTITDQLEKLYDVEFIYKSDSLQNFRYRGTIRLDHSILKALDMLQISTGIEYDVAGNQVTLDK